MSRPIAAEGTCRYSIGKPSRENADAGAAPPSNPMTAGSDTAIAVAPSNLRNTLASFGTHPPERPWHSTTEAFAESGPNRLWACRIRASPLQSLGESSLIS